jgi:hypothetical protein
VNRRQLYRLLDRGLAQHPDGRKLKELQEKGHPVDAEVLKVLSPYRREHINRLGDYLLDLLRSVPPLDPTIDFAFKSAA